MHSVRRLRLSGGNFDEVKTPQTKLHRILVLVASNHMWWLQARSSFLSCHTRSVHVKCTKVHLTSATIAESDAKLFSTLPFGFVRFHIGV